LVDGRGRPLVVLIGTGNGGDSPMLPALLASLRVARLGPGRARSRPDALLADKAYSARAHRAHLRARGIKTVIPERSDQIGHRQRRGQAGGRPVSFDAAAYKDRNVVERAFNRIKQWRGLATRYDKHATTYRGGVVLASIMLWLE
jgi:transposase